jgi:hypothetical protein
MSDFVMLWRDTEYRNGYEHPRRLYLLSQRGGDRYVGLRVKGHPMTILETADHNTIVAYGGGRYIPGHSCFRMDMDMTTRHATLQEVISNYFSLTGRCFDDGHSDGRDVVRAVYMLAHARGMRTLEYNDNSTKHCSPGGEVRLKLSDYYTLLEGKTWYESIFMEMGAVSVTPRYGITDDQLLEYRQNAAVVSWDKMRGTVVLPITLPADIDTSAPGSGRQVLQYLRKLNRPDMCEFIGVNMTNFMANSHIMSVHDNPWICVLPPNLTPKRERRYTHKASTSNKRKSTRKAIVRSTQNKSIPSINVRF